MPGRHWGVALRYGVPGVLLGVALSLAMGGRGGGRELWAQGPAPGLGGPMPMPMRGGASTAGGVAGDTIAFTTSGSGSSQMLYLIDTKSQAFAIYRIDSTKGTLTVKLDAARHYAWDMKLTAYNNLGPEPNAIESIVKTQGQQPQANR